MALAFLGAAALLTAAEAAFSFLPRHDAEQAVQGSQGPALRRILEQPMTHMRALRFWRIWFETASAVAVAVLLYSLLDNVWLAGLAATGIMAVLGFVLVGVSPRQLGRSHPASVAQYSASLVRFLAWVLGPIPAWLVRLGSAAAPGSPNGDDSYFSEEEFRELVDRATESDMIEDNEAELIQSVFEFGDTSSAPSWCRARTS
jgi:CBS domain containing-hemolysin-like protein